MTPAEKLLRAIGLAQGMLEDGLEPEAAAELERALGEWEIDTGTFFDWEQQRCVRVDLDDPVPVRLVSDGHGARRRGGPDS